MSTNARAERAMSRLMEHGLTRAQAAGVVGNLMHEAPSLNPDTEEAGKGTGYGLAQWTGVRLTGAKGLQAFAKKQGKPVSDFDTQIDFIAWELENTAPLAARHLKAAKTAEEAAKAFLHFERPKGYTVGNPAGAAGYKSRVAHAKTAYGMAGAVIEAAQGQPFADILKPSDIPSEQVAELQGQLQAIGLYNENIDGQYGPKTQEAVAALQQTFADIGAPISVDGVYGPQTAAALSALQQTMGPASGYPVSQDAVAPPEMSPVSALSDPWQATAMDVAGATSAAPAAWDPLPVTPSSAPYGFGAGAGYPVTDPLDQQPGYVSGPPDAAVAPPGPPMPQPRPSDTPAGFAPPAPPAAPPMPQPRPDAPTLAAPPAPPEIAEMLAGYSQSPYLGQPQAMRPQPDAPMSAADAMAAWEAEGRIDDALSLPTPPAPPDVTAQVSEKAGDTGLAIMAAQRAASPAGMPVAPKSDYNAPPSPGGFGLTYPPEGPASMPLDEALALQLERGEAMVPVPAGELNKKGAWVDSGETAYIDMDKVPPAVLDKLGYGTPPAPPAPRPAPPPGPQSWFDQPASSLVQPAGGGVDLSKTEGVWSTPPAPPRTITDELPDVDYYNNVWDHDFAEPNRPAPISPMLKESLYGTPWDTAPVSPDADEFGSYLGIRTPVPIEGPSPLGGAPFMNDLDFNAPRSLFDPNLANRAVPEQPISGRLPGFAGSGNIDPRDAWTTQDLKQTIGEEFQRDASLSPYIQSYASAIPSDVIASLGSYTGAPSGYTDPGVQVAGGGVNLPESLGVWNQPELNAGYGGFPGGIPGEGMSTLERTPPSPGFGGFPGGIPGEQMPSIPTVSAPAGDDSGIPTVTPATTAGSPFGRSTSFATDAAIAANLADQALPGGAISPPAPLVSTQIAAPAPAPSPASTPAPTPAPGQVVAQAARPSPVISALLGGTSRAEPQPALLGGGGSGSSSGSSSSGGRPSGFSSSGGLFNGGYGNTPSRSGGGSPIGYGRNTSTGAITGPSGSATSGGFYASPSTGQVYDHQGRPVSGLYRDPTTGAVYGGGSASYGGGLSSAARSSLAGGTGGLY
jgi:peptidoglycan hydrolase-like protein with peptidoglycan-binding domain